MRHGHTDGPPVTGSPALHRFDLGRPWTNRLHVSSFAVSLSRLMIVIFMMMNINNIISIVTIIIGLHYYHYRFYYHHYSHFFFSEFEFEIGLVCQE